MKHLKPYKIFENDTSIIDNVNEMLLELNDDGFKCRASDGGELPPGVTKNIPMGYKLVKTHDLIFVRFSKDNPGFDFDDIKEVYWRIKSYLTDNGYLEDNDNLQDILRNREGAIYFTLTSFTKPI